VTVEQRDKPKNPISTIAIDAIYTPIRTVNFFNENVRVGQMTNYDRLRIDITTDGSITPAEALNQAAVILVDHFQFICNTEIEGQAVKAEAVEKEADTEDDGEAAEKPKKRASRAAKASTESVEEEK
jgi:DNA-directed RNA polymerase subunit alpha